MRMNHSYHVPLDIDKTRVAVREAVVQLSWPLESDDGSVLRVHTETAKSTRMSITLLPDRDGTSVQVVAKLLGFGPWVKRDLRGRINQFANAVSVTAKVSVT